MNNKSNNVILVGTYGGDETHALAAWASTSREITEERRERLPDFLAWLAQSEPVPHSVPFEKSMIHFVVLADTASHIHLLKHRIGTSINGESARYKELREDKYHIPDDWPDEVKYMYQEHIIAAYEMYHLLIEQLERKLGRGRAKESARYVLPYGNQTYLDVSFNFLSFVNFLKRRYDEQAQKEIRDIAEQMLRLVQETGNFTHSLAAFGYAT